MASPPVAAPTRRLYRRRDSRLVAGVAAGLSDHLGIDLLLLRIAFVISIVLGGLGVLIYAAFWVVVPESDDDTVRSSRSETRAQLVAFAALAAAMLLVAQLLGFGASLMWPAAAVATGAAILWRQADESGRNRWRTVAERAVLREGPGRTAARMLAGVALVVLGLSTFLATQDAFQQEQVIWLVVDHQDAVLLVAQNRGSSRSASTLQD